MKKIAGLALIIWLFSLNILADVPPPPVGEQIRIELEKNYPDYQFYIASYNLKVVPNPNPPHISRPNMIVPILDSFKLKKIDLTFEKPVIQSITSSRIEYRGSLAGENLYLVAVKKSLGEIAESKIRDALDNLQNEAGIYTARLWQELDSKKDYKVGAKVIVNKVTNLDDKGLKIDISEGTSVGIVSKTSSCIGLGLFLTGMAFVGIWWTRKRIV
jgi:hypothetical protein